MNTRRGEFMGVVFILAVVALIGTWTFSLHNYQASVDELETSSMMKVVEVADEAPPPPPPKVEDKQLASNKVTMKEIVQSIDQTTEAPPDTKGQKNVKPPPDYINSKDIAIGDRDSIPTEGEYKRGSGTGTGSGLQGVEGGTGGDDDEPPPPPPTPKPVPKMISGGVVNGKATNLVKPPYPPAARAVRAAGSVSVQVVIDEGGSVISASAVSGHPLLRAAAVQAARSSRFSPTLLSGQAVKVSGTIVYNFVP